MKPVEKPTVAKQAIAHTAESLHTNAIAWGAKMVSSVCRSVFMWPFGVHLSGAAGSILYTYVATTNTHNGSEQKGRKYKRKEK